MGALRHHAPDSWRCLQHHDQSRRRALVRLVLRGRIGAGRHPAGTRGADHCDGGRSGRREAVAGGAIGIDWGVERHSLFPPGKVIQLPRVTAAEREHLAVLQRRISTKERNSANWP